MKFELNAQARTLQGSGASRRLRRAGKVPGIIYGGTAAPQAIELDHNDLLLEMKKEAFHASILVISVDGKKQQALLRDTQMHAYKPKILHVDFQRVSATEALHLMVPLHFINEETAPGVKLSGGRVNHVLTEVDVQCLPKDLPEFIEVDVGALEVGESIHLSDLKLPKGVKLTHEDDDALVVGIVAKGGGEEGEEGEAAEGEAAA
ncbi:MAG TPA: 50S ribosomal protein L25/general stress protein Ctc [Azonexus sp.]|jgi:large subunit ribosomal protein L25|uniref:Large ribosomal subunit protein bL25 n=1 Tax=Candidatus Dechloromonas phosphorivorans TaxID=2899244 RepID=A0A9D7LM68_9RHOO|nr:50S ribosomal protein L25/general stress protein Ctc [Candidatus Dechloromonas phosphorivorans]HRH12791.1 50S ribosomal protein L25/general stress protein Ctc [Azonexus sp.]